MHNLLIVDDECSIRDSIKLALMGEPYVISEAETLDSAFDKILHSQPDIMLLDIHFQEGKTSHDLLEKLRNAGIKIPTILLSGAASAKQAVDAIKLGAYDYLEKPVSSERLKVSLNRCLQSSATNQKLEAITKPHNLVSDLIGESSCMREVTTSINIFSPKPVKVLITGETGTGKEIVANAIWKGSKLKSKPFIIINCAAVPESLIESELFGHKKGAFTGATSNQIGKLEMASGGTVFLDEIGELSLNAQSKLLRFLDNDEIQPVGSNSTKKCVVRVVAATSRDLEQEMEKNHFRKDLYFRLNVGRIELPPLRMRGEDIKKLFNFFVSQASHRYEEVAPQVNEKSYDLLSRYSWPGNVRELKNIAERSVLQASGEITEGILGKLGVVGGPGKVNSNDLQSSALVSLKEFKAKSEADYIIKVIQASDGKIAQAARVMEIDRTYLHQKMNQLGVTKKDYM